MPDASAYAILVVAGFVSGVLNVVAAGGSFLTLPILLFLGVPAVVANGTNRLGVVMQNVSAIWGFQRAGLLDWRWALTASVPALIGSVFGTWAAFYVDDESFRRLLAIAMVGFTVVTMMAPEPGDTPTHRAGSWFVALGFFAAGIYGGFLQAGVGFLVLAITTWAGLDLVRGNAIKVVSVLLLTGISFAIFALNGRIHWPMAVALAIGNAIGGLVGVRIAIARGHRWLKGVVTITVIAFAVRLWWS